VRPGDIGVGGGRGAQSVPAEVIVVEPTGAETELLIRVGASEFVVVLHGRTQAQPGDRIHLAIDATAVHLFDPTSGTTLAA
jgi:multiple sugar transport system ATP-binding protein